MANDASPEDPIAVPKWDVALEAMIKEEHGQLGRPLTLDDFRRLAQQYTIRLDDIMVTLLELCVRGLWHYQDADGKQLKITRQRMTQLTAGGRRLNDADLKSFSGGWTPAG